MVGIRESFLLGVRPLFRCELLVVSFREGNHVEVSEDFLWDFFFWGSWSGVAPRYVNVYIVYIYNLHGWLIFLMVKR